VSLRTHLWTLAVLLLLGCGVRPTTQSPEQGKEQRQNAGVQKLLSQARAHLRAKAFVKAKRLLVRAAASNPTKIQSDTILLIQAGLVARDDPGRGTDAYLRVVETAHSSTTRKEARRRAILSAVKAKRCLTAIKLQEGLLEPTLEVTLATVQCHDMKHALLSLTRQLSRDPSNPKTLSALRKILGAAEASALFPLLNQPAYKGIERIIAKEILGRNLPNTPAATLKKIHGILPDEDPAKALLNKRLSRPSIKILLPLSGPFRPIGTNLKAALEAILSEDSEDAVSTGPHVTILDGGTFEKANAALEHSEDGKRPFATIGVFDADTSAQLAAHYVYTSEPLIMLTVSNKVTGKDAPIWRAVHTPLLVARTVASAAIQLGARHALIIRRNDGYGREHAQWFSRVWENAKRGSVAELVLKKTPPNFVQIAASLEKRKFDTLFIPMKAIEAAELFQHLAANHIWAKGPKPRFAPTEGMREVLILGTPEWYTPKFVSVARRYGKYVMFPSIYASETARGAVFARQVQRETGRPPTAVLAILSDAIAAMNEANAYHLREKVSPLEAVQKLQYDQGVTAGLDFTRKDRRGQANRDAVSRLFMLQLGLGRVHVLGELK